MNRVPVSGRGLSTSPDPRKPPLPRGGQRRGPSVPALASSTSLLRSVTVGGRGVTHGGVSTSNLMCREGCGDSTFLRMVAHASRTTVSWSNRQHPSRPQVPPRLAPLAATPLVARGCHPPKTTHAPCTSSASSEEVSRAQRRARGVAGAVATSVGVARSALSLQTSTVATTGGRFAPEPVWRRSKPLTRLSSTTVGRALDTEMLPSSEITVPLCSTSMSRERRKTRNTGAAALVLSRKQDPDGFKCVFDDGATRSGRDGVGFPHAVTVAAKNTLVPSKISLVPSAESPKAVSTSLGKESKPFVSPPTGEVEGACRADDEDLINVFMSSSPPLITSPGSLSGEEAEGSVDGVLWAHEAPGQPAYAHTHQLPALFSQLVDDLQSARPSVDGEGGESSVGRWMQSWFGRQYAMQSLFQSSAHSVRQLNRPDVSSFGVAVSMDCHHAAASSDHLGLGKEPAVDQESGHAVPYGVAPRLSADSSTVIAATTTAVTSSAVMVTGTETTAKPASPSVLKTPSTGSPSHAYVPLTAEGIRSGLQSRMTSGASVRETTPPKPAHTKSPPAPLAALHTTSASSTLHPRPHSEADGGGGVLVVVVGHPSSAQQQQQQQQQQQPLPVKPLSGSPRLSAPPSAPSISRKQSVVAAAALTAGVEGDKGSTSIRPKLATKSYAVFAHSTSSSAPKEAAHPHE